MPQVSRFPLRPGVKDRLFKIFWSTLASFKKATDAEKFFKDLLTPTEQTMLAKRLGIAILLLKGEDYRTIVDTLKVSPTTVNKIQLWLKTGGEGYKKAVEKILNSERVEEFKDELEATVLGFMGGRHILKGKILAAQKRAETRRKKFQRGNL